MQTQQRLFYLFILANTFFNPCSQALPQDAYVWQRLWDERLESSLAEHADALQRLNCLAAEITPGVDRDAVTLIDINYVALKTSNRPITLAIRVGQYPGPFTSDARTTQTLLSVVNTVLERARAHSLDVAGVQIDYDCATSMLEGYRAWLKLLRGQLGDTPLSITTLPTWMSRPETFANLIEQTDYYVLQVHSIQRPNSPSDEIQLCNAKQSLHWTAQAKSFNHPFLVALPTYGYELAFDDSGELVSVNAENASRERNPAWSYQQVRADPVEMARLVRHFEKQKTKHLRGIIWYRLPVAEERLNWDAVTWRAVMRADADLPQWRAEAVPQDNGVIEIQLAQTSPIATQPPNQIALTWSDAEAVAWDGQRHFTVDQTSEHRLVWRRPSDANALPQGTKWTLGWVRLDRETTLQLTVIQ